MDINNTEEGKKPKGSINPLLEKFLAVNLGLAIMTMWVIIIAVLTRFLISFFGIK